MNEFIFSKVTGVQVATFVRLNIFTGISKVFYFLATFNGNFCVFQNWSILRGRILNF